MILAALSQREVFGASHTLSSPHCLVMTSEENGHDKVAVSPASVSGHKKVLFVYTVSLVLQNPTPVKLYGSNIKM